MFFWSEGQVYSGGVGCWLKKKFNGLVYFIWLLLFVVSTQEWMDRMMRPFITLFMTHKSLLHCTTLLHSSSHRPFNPLCKLNLLQQLFFFSIYCWGWSLGLACLVIWGSVFYSVIQWVWGWGGAVRNFWFAFSSHPSLKASQLLASSWPPRLLFVL